MKNLSLAKRKTFGNSFIYDGYINVTINSKTCKFSNEISFYACLERRRHTPAPSSETLRSRAMASFRTWPAQFATECKARTLSSPDQTSPPRRHAPNKISTSSASVTLPLTPSLARSVTFLFTRSACVISIQFRPFGHPTQMTEQSENTAPKIQRKNRNRKQ